MVVCRVISDELLFIVLLLLFIILISNLTINSKLMNINYSQQKLALTVMSYTGHATNIEICMK